MQKIRTYVEINANIFFYLFHAYRKGCFLYKSQFSHESVSGLMLLYSLEQEIGIFYGTSNSLFFCCRFTCQHFSICQRRMDGTYSFDYFELHAYVI